MDGEVGMIRLGFLRLLSADAVGRQGKKGLDYSRYTSKHHSLRMSFGYDSAGLVFLRRH